jgi:hypothetical protein
MPDSSKWEHVDENSLELQRGLQNLQTLHIKKGKIKKAIVSILTNPINHKWNESIIDFPNN